LAIDGETYSDIRAWGNRVLKDKDGKVVRIVDHTARNIDFVTWVKETPKYPPYLADDEDSIIWFLTENARAGICGLIGRDMVNVYSLNEYRLLPVETIHNRVSGGEPTLNKTNEHRLLRLFI
jgi:phage tail sheath protein FI